MEQLASKLKKMQEYSTRTVGGYYLSNFHMSNAYSGQKTFRLHFKRDGNSKPTTFDISIQHLNDYVVSYKDRDQDVQHLTFPDYESVITYLSEK